MGGGNRLCSREDEMTQGAWGCRGGDPSPYELVNEVLVEPCRSKRCWPMNAPKTGKAGADRDGSLSLEAWTGTEPPSDKERVGASDC